MVEAAPARIRESQRPAMFHRVDPPGIMGLLNQALAAQKGRSRAVLCGAMRSLFAPRLPNACVRFKNNAESDSEQPESGR